MEAKNIACATSNKPVGWHAIDWRKVNQDVHRLQARIVKAAQEDKWNRVKVGFTPKNGHQVKENVESTWRPQ